MNYSFQRLRLGLPTCLLLAVSTAGFSQTQPAPSPDLSAVLAELRRLTQLVETQQQRMDALTATVAEQQARIQQLQSPVLGSAPVLVASAVPAAVPLPQVTGPQISLPKAPPAPAPKKEAAPLKWYEKYSLRGYTQLRYNRLFESNPDLVCEQCDRSIGNNNGFSFRRARFVLSGDINDRIAFYFQPDFASTSGNLNFGQIRDLYADVALDAKKRFRVRLGQSKIPYGFEPLQSSQNRLNLDRADGMNSAFANERDIGVFAYYAPETIRRRFANLVSSGLKGSGDYGVFGVGAFNGQVINRQEGNNNLHYATRLTYPWELKNGQFIEASVQAYTGAYAVTSDQRGVATRGPVNFADKRIAASLIVYPQPVGFQAEYNIGRGPEYNPRANAIQTRGLIGGYAQTMFMRRYNGHVFTPFLRYQYYNGGKKQEFDARSYLVRDIDLGLEWQRNAFFEITAQYSRADRTFEDSRTPNNRQKGNLFRLQIQLNY